MGNVDFDSIMDHWIVDGVEIFKITPIFFSCSTVYKGERFGKE